MKILSLFDGIAGARIALDKANVPVESYFSSEIDKWALKVSSFNYPDIINLGDVRAVNSSPCSVDLLIGGSPCTSLSCASRQKESGLLKGESTLFWEYLRVFNLVKPRFFLLENVASMKSSDRDIISLHLGVKPVSLPSRFFSPQDRKRLYWTNIPINFDNIPYVDSVVSDILDFSTPFSKSFPVHFNSKFYTLFPDFKYPKMVRIGQFNRGSQSERVYAINGKFSTLVCSHNTDLVFIPNKGSRRLTPLECERLQTIPDNYTALAPKTIRHKLIGLSFTIDVISFILSYFSTS